MCDSGDRCDTGRRRYITIEEPPPIAHEPVANDDEVTFTPDAPRPIDVTANDTDEDDDLDVTSVTVTTMATQGTTTVDPATGVVTYTAGPGRHRHRHLRLPGVRRDRAVRQRHRRPHVHLPAGRGRRRGHHVTPRAGERRRPGQRQRSRRRPRRHDAAGHDAADPGQTSVDLGDRARSPTRRPTGPPAPTRSSYEICDDSGLCDTATVTITFVFPPDAVDDMGTATPGQSSVLDVLANDSDPDGDLDPTTVTVTLVPDQGTTTVDPTTGAVTYTANGGASGQDSFTYEVCDDTGRCDTATVLILFRFPPVANDDAGRPCPACPIDDRRGRQRHRSRRRPRPDHRHGDHRRRPRAGPASTR